MKTDQKIQKIHGLPRNFDGEKTLTIDNIKIVFFAQPFFLHFYKISLNSIVYTNLLSSTPIKLIILHNNIKQVFSKGPKFMNLPN